MLGGQAPPGFPGQQAAEGQNPAGIRPPGF